MVGQEFAREKHIQHFCLMLKCLPQPYQGALDTSRMTVVYFCVVGLDVLGALDRVDKHDIIEWVYGMQVLPSDNNEMVGGFRGSLHLGAPFHSGGTKSAHNYDTGHLAMTYTALCLLVTLGDDLSRVNKRHVVDALRLCQQQDGSFRPTPNGAENDMRFVYCAAAISHLLNDYSGVHVDKVVEYVENSIGYEGGIGLNPDREAHGGSMYTGLASLFLLGRASAVLDHPSRKAGLVRWCVNRLAQGFHGRPNKMDDTCYAFWVGASLDLLGAKHLLGTDGLREFLLDTQSKIGGFGKHPETHPDILHSFYGVTGWSVMLGNADDTPNPIHPALGITQRAAVAGGYS